jgi:hypothetical protein
VALVDRKVGVTKKADLFDRKKARLHTEPGFLTGNSQSKVI